MARRSIRFKHYDYSAPGFYFVTICTHQKKHLLGKIERNQMLPSAIGNLIHQCWLSIPKNFHHTVLDAFTLMPNHIHGIIRILENDLSKSSDVSAGPKGTKSGSLGAIVQNFKSVSTRRGNVLSRVRNLVWQRNYYERIIRTEKELNLVRLYIELNPVMWSSDTRLNQMESLSIEQISMILEKYRPEHL